MKQTNSKLNGHLASLLEDLRVLTGLEALMLAFVSLMWLTALLALTTSSTGLLGPF